MIRFSQFESVVRIRIVGRFARRLDFVHQSRVGQITHDVRMNFFPPSQSHLIPDLGIDREGDILEKNVIGMTTNHTLLDGQAFAVQIAVYPHGLGNVDD